jgi:hypothetical protein
MKGKGDRAKARSPFSQTLTDSSQQDEFDSTFESRENDRLVNAIAESYHGRHIGYR